MKSLLVLLFSCLSMPLWAGEGTPAIAITPRMTDLVIQVGVILFAARLGNLLFKRLRLPTVLGELCAGILIGPYALGRLFPGWCFQPFAGSSVVVSPELYGLCTVASIVLLFLVGVETDLRMFMRYSAVGSLVGIGGVALSYVAGAWVGVWLMGLGWTDPTTILMGVMSTATSVSITARILSERHKLDSREGVTILAGAVIDDVLGIIMLAIGMSMIAAEASGDAIRWGQIGIIAGRSFGTWLIATAVGLLISRWVVRILKPCGSLGEVSVLALGIALLTGGLFESFHLAMIIGAYITGLAFSRTEMALMLQEKLRGLHQFLVPIFFVVMGMMVDVSQFADRHVLAVGLVYTAVAIAAKIIGCGLPTLCFGFTPMGALRIGLGMVPRGEVALIIAGIAAATGHHEVLGVAVLMTLLTTLVAPPLLLLAFRSPRSGHRSPATEQTTPKATYRFANHAVTNAVMARISQALMRDGFFVHQIDPTHGLYQARRADRVLTIQSSGTTITFSVPEDMLPFVRVVVAEALAEFETLLDALRKPQEESVRLGLEETPAEPTPKSKHHALLRQLIRKENILLDLQATNRDDVIREMLSLLHQAGKIADPRQAEQEILQREATAPTCVGGGVACPHARTDSVQSLVCAIGIPKTPIDFSEEDNGKACRILVLTLAPTDATGPYMAFLTAILTVLRSDAKREALLHAPDAKTLRECLLSP